MWCSTRVQGKTLNQPSVVSKQTAKISKTVFAKNGYTAISKHQWIGVSSTKTDFDKFESWKNFLPNPGLDVFHQNHPFTIHKAVA